MINFDWFKLVPAIPGHILPPVTNSNQLENSMSVDGVEPPVPPPRPGQHGRSMSVDYKGMWVREGFHLIFWQDKSRY